MLTSAGESRRSGINANVLTLLYSGHLFSISFCTQTALLFDNDTKNCVIGNSMYYF